MVLARDREIQNLKIIIEIHQKEIANLRSSWSREQAEWRELWDRARSVWENEKKEK